MLGLVDLGNKTPEVKSLVLESEGVRVEDVTIALEEDFQARALLFVPQGKAAGAVIALPDSEESREAFAGIAEGETPATWLTSLLEQQLVVCVPVTVERESDFPFGKLHHIDRRRLLYRLGFVVGRTPVGLEVQQTLALRTYLVSRFLLRKQQVAVLGEGQGGMTALFTAAIDGSLGAVAVVDYFQQRERSWEEPVDRMPVRPAAKNGPVLCRAHLAGSPVVE